MPESIMNPHLFNVHLEKLKEDYNVYANFARPFGSGTEKVIEYHIELTNHSSEILLAGFGILYAIRQFDPEQMDNQEELSLKIKVIDQVLFPQKYISTDCYMSLVEDLETIIGLHEYNWNPETAVKWTVETLNGRYEGLNDKFYITASHFENTDIVSINFTEKLDTRAELCEIFELKEQTRKAIELRGKIIQREALEKQLEARRKAHEEVTLHDIIHKFYN